jgi:hypothetical protein
MIADQDNSAVSVRANTSWVSVAELLERHVPMHWSEAVAVVAELCAVLLERGAPVIPHPSDVLINGQGTLAIRTEDVGESNPAALGRMLHNLCATASPPAPLRLFVSHAISSDRYQSVSAFADALKDYEAPGHDKLIRAAHDRWVATRTETSAASAEIPLRPEPQPEKTAEPKADSRRRLPRWAIATAAVAVVSGGGAGAWLATGATVPSLPPISFSSISASVPAVIQQALAWVGGSGASHVAAAEAQTTSTKPARRVKPRGPAKGARTITADLDAASTAGLTETTPATGSITPVDATDALEGLALTAVVVSDGSAPGGAVAEPGDTGESFGTLEEVATAEDAIVYSRASLGVMPPVMMTRQIARPEALTPGVEAVSTIEVMVDEAGEVEQVKLLSRPSPILATMLLSAAKTWKFRPALHDGQPVRYRLRLDVTTTRP